MLLSLRLSNMTLIGFFLLAFAGVPRDAWAAGAGVTSIEFAPAVLANLGMEVDASATAPPQLPGQIGFAADDPATLLFVAPGGDFEGFSGGELQHRGRLLLRVGGQVLVLSDFVLRVAANPRELDLFDQAGRRRLRFEAAQPYVRAGELHLQNVDVTVAAELAEELGQPELEGVYLGHAHVRLPVPSHALDAQPAGTGQCDDVFTADRDVSLQQLGTVSQLEREPGGRVALTLSAVLRNAGTSAILWKEAIEPDGVPENVGEHPYLALHVYRLQGSRIKQIGRSDVKHAFFTVNEKCPCAGGHVIYPGCEDVYGASTNANRLHLGPREEVTLATGAWTRLGSHFDALPVNDFRDHDGESAHDGFEHLLTVQEADLQEGGEFYVEGWYIVRDDVDLFNSMGNYPISPDLGAGWTFGAPTAVMQGSILERLLAAAAPASSTRAGLLDTGEGRLQLAVVTTELGGGQFHHEYALMNFDFDRQIGAFEIVLEAGVDVANVEFVDVDRDSGNDWSFTIGGSTLTWSAPAGNEQDWGTLHSFAFDTDAESPEMSVTVFAAEPGTPASYDIPAAAVGGGAGDADDADGSGGSSSGFALGPTLAALTLVALAAYRRRRRTR